MNTSKKNISSSSRDEPKRTDVENPNELCHLEKINRERRRDN